MWGCHPPQEHYKLRPPAALNPPPLACGPAPLGAAISYKRTVSCDHRLGSTTRPPSF